MTRYEPQDCNIWLLQVVVAYQIVPDSFAFALDYLAGNEHDHTALNAKFNHDEIGTKRL